MLKSGDLPTRYGVCAALQSLGKRSAAATDELILQLAEKDSWLRVQAAQALACHRRTGPQGGAATAANGGP